jgi:hypothetical protein
LAVIVRVGPASSIRSGVLRVSAALAHVGGDLAASDDLDRGRFGQVISGRHRQRPPARRERDAILAVEAIDVDRIAIRRDEANRRVHHRRLVTGDDADDAAVAIGSGRKRA